MMVVTAKIKKRNLFLFGAILIGILFILLWPSKKEKPALDSAGTISTNEGRIAFMQELGWEVEEAPVQTQQIVIPAEENEVYTRYNELQKAQGYDLDKYAGKTVRRYVYAVTNHPGTEQPYYLTLLIYKDKVIGGDVASSAANGKMGTMQFPQNYSNT